MCGIAGIIQSSLRFTVEDLQKMTASVAHRGPDGEGVWQNKNAVALLGHRRLSVIDLSIEAAQPMHYQSRYTITYNGEIYNYIELKAILQKEGYHFNTQSDTEVILAAYDYWDDACVEHFDGMFSFAIWDEEEQDLFAARDRFGEKPFFYYNDKETFIFGSEIKALFAAGVQRTANLKMLFNFITIGYLDNPAKPEETFFDNISRLPPASKLFYTPATKELVIEKYWAIDTDLQHDKITEADAIEKFQALFAASVAKRLRSDVAVGSSLSGGLDSSSIVAVAASLRNTSAPFASFTASFPGFEKDETLYAKQVAAQFQCVQHTVDITANHIITDWEKFLYHQEEPVGSASAFAQYKVFELAKEHGVTVLLDGQGADETLAGYHKYYKWYWQELFQKRKLVRSGEIAAARKIGITEKFGVKNIMASLLPDLATVILERQYLLNAIRHKDLDKEFVKQQSKEAYYTTPAISSLNGVLYFNTCVHGLEELLRYADRNSMAHGREVRLPFLNHELVEFIFSLPASFKIHHGWTKWIARKAVEKKLPDAITWRQDKTGFEPPQKTWMQHTTMQEMIQDARKKLVKEHILHAGALQKEVLATDAYTANPYDWRYLVAAAYL